MEEDRARPQLRWTGAFRDEAAEVAYRADRLRIAGPSLAVAAVAAASLFLAFIPSDVALAGSTAAWVTAAAVRVLGAAALLCAAVVLRRRPPWVHTGRGDALFTAVAVVAAASFVGVVALRPVAITNLVVSAVLFGVATVLFAPLTLTRRIAVVGAFDAAFLAVLALRVDDEVIPMWSFVALLGLNLVSTALCARHLEVTGRVAFAAVQQSARTSAALRVALATSDELRRELAAQLASDDLTGLMSRRAFLDRGTADDAGSLLAIEVDHFKAINDGHGHAAGDTVLRSVGDLIRASTRPDDVAARLGGEEFAVWLPGADHVAAAQVAERIRASVEQARWTVDDLEIAITVSVGTAERRDGDSFDELLRRADLAMYAAKAAGRNRIGCGSPSCTSDGTPCGPALACLPVPEPPAGEPAVVPA